jgi:hypothetical protein
VGRAGRLVRALRQPGLRDAEGRRHEWHDWAELEHLHDMVAALIAEAIDNPTSPEPHQQEQTA